MRVLLLCLLAAVAYSQTPCTSTPWAVNNVTTGNCTQSAGAATSYANGTICAPTCATGMSPLGGDIPTQTCNNGQWVPSRAANYLCEPTTTPAPTTTAATTTTTPVVTDPTTSTTTTTTTPIVTDPTTSTTTTTASQQTTSTTSSPVTDPTVSTTKSTTTTSTPNPTTTAATTTTAAPPATTIVSSTTTCTTQDAIRNGATIIYVCANNMVCMSGTCATTTVATTSTTTVATTATTTLPATTTTSAPITIIYSIPGAQCTGDSATNVVVNPRYACSKPAICAEANATVVCATGVARCCYLPPTPTTTTPPSTTAAPGTVGQPCSNDRPCASALSCISSTCQVPPPASTQAPTTASAGGPCGSAINTVCPQGYRCVASAAALAANQTVDQVGGTCQPTTTPSATASPCPAGTQPNPVATTANSQVAACVPCPYGTFSEHGLACKLCPTNYYTPLPSGFNPATALTVGPTKCALCPAYPYYVPDPACNTTAKCDNCAAAGDVCIWVPSTNLATTQIPTTFCQVPCAGACNSTQACINGVCTEISNANVPPATAQVIAGASGGLTSVGVTDPATATSGGVATTPNTATTGQVTVLTGNPVTVPAVTATGPIVVDNDLSVTTNQLTASGSGSSVVLGSGSSVNAGNVDVTNDPSGNPTVAKIATTTTGTPPTVTANTVNLGGNALSLLGGVIARLGNVIGDATAAYVQSSGATVDTTTINVPFRVVSDGTNPASVTLTGQVSTQAIVGGGSVNVSAGAQLTTSSGIEADVHVDGTASISNNVVSGSINVSASGVLDINAPSSTAPYLDAFKGCNGVIYFHITDSCDTSKTGTLWTTSSNTNFQCEIIVVGKGGCQVGPLQTSNSALGAARRLLGSTSDSGCTTGSGMSTVSSTGATYQLCGSKSSASTRSLSYIVLFVSMFAGLLSFFL